MSLKSKLEAVIYASEEPVTLTQLATLFGAEALEWKAAQDAAAQKAAAESAANPADPSQPANDEGLEYLDLRTEDGRPFGEPESTDPGLAEVKPGSNSASVTSELAPETVQPETVRTTPAEEATLDPEAEAKRAARQRDREIKTILRQLIDELIAFYASDDRGVEIREIAGGYRMATKPECHDAVRMFIKSLKPALKLSLPALETLAVIAYKQPVTAPEVNEIRGVDSSGVFGSLLARKLITTAGRKPVIGRPILYKTTKEFLMRFGLKDVAELPSMDEFEKMASELEEVDPVAVDEGDAATAEYEAEGSTGPALDENAPEEPDNDSPATTETSTEMTATVHDTQDKAEPAE
ncbi:MAG TPA: SMC-Scp complex subunit ScpB [Terracidiphilus sp.]|nr:SMC-Scp complex subunit ScpB [Terracidiphilus sp.]